MSKSLYCPDCNNAERFSVSSREYRTWHVDGKKNYESDNGCDDADMGSEFFCDDCGSLVTEHEFCDDGCGKPKDKCACKKSCSYETRVRVAMSFYVYISTKSRPEDIDKDLMDEIIRAHAIDYVQQLKYAHDLYGLIDEYDYEE